MTRPDKILRITKAHLLAVTALPMIHRDPFDRLLVAQAHAGAFADVISDRLVTAHAVLSLW